MSNVELFASAGKRAQAADTVNAAGGVAYSLSSQEALAQMAATGCFGDTYYASAETQLATILDRAAKCPEAFVAKAAIYARERGHMKDAPAVLLAHLSTRGPEGLRCMKLAFPRALDNGKMVRNFVQVIRSGVVGRKSLGTAPRNAVRAWLASRDPVALFRDSVGNEPSMADVIKMVHPKPCDPSRDALLRYMIGKPHTVEGFALLPQAVRDFDEYKEDRSRAVPDVPFQMLTALNLGAAEWSAIARTASWQTTRMNLNTFARHGVFGDPAMVDVVAARLRDADAIRRARVFPYQLLTAFLHISPDVPAPLGLALQDAMEIACENVPTFDGKRLVVCVDVSGSMSSPITGHRVGATSKTRCVDVAALIAAALLRTNPTATVIPFATGVVGLRLNHRDSVMTLAQQLAAVGGGGTNCSAPLRLLNGQGAKADVVVYVSDNESWLDTEQRWHAGKTAMASEWAIFAGRNPGAKLVCIDLTPNTTAQVKSRPNALNVGGFSDDVFSVLRDFVMNTSPNWVDKVEAVML